MEIDNLKFSTHYSNLSKNEWNALKSLRKRADIVIKKADKNNNIVILKSDTYISQGLMHIDSIHYEKMETLNTHMIQSDVQALVERLHLTNEIDKTTYKFLRQGFQNNKCGRLYFLPKVHKLSGGIIINLENIHNRITIKIPGRPLSGRSGPTSIRPKSIRPTSIRPHVDPAHM